MQQTVKPCRQIRCSRAFHHSLTLQSKADDQQQIAAAEKRRSMSLTPIFMMMKRGKSPLLLLHRQYLSSSSSSSSLSSRFLPPLFFIHRRDHNNLRRHIFTAEPSQNRLITSIHHRCEITTISGYHHFAAPITFINGSGNFRQRKTATNKMGSITQLSSVEQHKCALLHTNGGPAVAPAAPLTLEPLAGPDTGILVARISVPSTRNAFSRALAQAFRDMVDQLRYGLETRALILTSSVPQAFCSGVDLKERRKMTSNEVSTFVDGLRRTITDLSELPFPVIACIDGCALGGGLELALACDMRIATPRSELGLPETRLAIIPGCGGTQRLPRVVGVAKAKELILTGRKVRGDEAAQIGLLNHLTDDPYAKALEIARDVLKTGPLANRVAKLAVEQGFDLELRSGLVVEQQCYAQLMPTKDRLEALEAFAQKRPPKFKGE
ncbi:hypothetical protein niasHS_006123 [Heterodera schachtii]|uniref:Enoyl-CoA hydratase n=1 Tax=Heterodera schachtii TaxID=97005 RepID=A0ABD2JW79_HETSC